MKGKCNTGGENVKAEVEYQTPVITQIAENLGVTITTPSGTNKQILQGNNANLLNIKNNAKKEGLYVWKKSTKPITLHFTQTSGAWGTPITLQVTSSEIDVNTLTGEDFVGVKGTCGSYTYEFTSATEFIGLTYTSPIEYSYSNGIITIQGTIASVETWSDYTKEGQFLDYVVSDNESAYPYGGEQGGYWYKIYGGPFNIVTWANGTDEEIVKMVEMADQGVINLSDYWAVGDIRTVQLSAMSATGVGESHAAQQVDLVLMHAGGYDLNEAVASGRTKCSFVVGLKDSLAEAGYMNSSNTNSGSWNGSARRTWCNNVFRNAIPSTLRVIFKQFKTVTAQTYNGSTNQTSVDYFALPAEREIFDARNQCNQTEYNALFQFDYYKTASNRVKKRGKTGTSSLWWERSPYYNYSAFFCDVTKSGEAGYDNANSSYGLAPFGCI